MSKKSSEKSKGHKNHKVEDKSPITTNQNEQTLDVLENPVNLKTIIITVESYKNIVPLYPLSDIKTSLKYLDKDVGESHLIPVTDDENLIINESFEISIDVNSTRQVDLLASNPIFLTATQISGTLDPTVYEQLKECQELKPVEKSAESLFSLYEAFTGDIAEVKISDLKKSSKKGKKQKPEKKTEDKGSKAKSKSVISKSSKASKSSKGSANNGDNISKISAAVIKSEVYGMCVIDLIPLFYGETSFTERLVLNPINKSCKILSTYKNLPQVTVTVSVKENINLVDMINILNFTVESICNVPLLMTSDMDCKTCIQLPLEHSATHPTIFYNPKITQNAPLEEVPKRWPCIHDIGYNSNTTKYFINQKFENVKSKLDFDLNQGYENDATRLEFNYLKRNVLFKNGINDFAAQVVTHRKLILEIYLTTKGKTSRQDKSYDSAADDPDLPKTKSSKLPPHLHLMAVLDISSLLYPGVTKVRLASPVKTFTYEEAFKEAGLEDSYFLPKPKSDKELVTTKTSKTKLDIGRKKKADKQPGKSSKKEKDSTWEEKNLQSQLPPKPDIPPAPEPSVQVYNDEGKPCFIIVEFELLKPITPKRNLDELKSDLYELQMKAVSSPKTILNKHVAHDFYKQTISEIVDDLNKNFHKFNENKSSISDKSNRDFLTYLQKTGAYQTYLSSVTNAAILVITNNYKCIEHDLKNNKTYQNLISEIFTDLMSDMHSVLNTLVCTGMKPMIHKYDTSKEDGYFYAKEATELKLYDLADRYFLERIVNDQDRNPDYWFDYAIFNLEIKKTDRALECVKEAVSRDCNHKYSLLLFGALLTEKEKIQDAETCFLNIMVQEPKWVEGWCVLFLFYQKSGKPEGMDMALDMANKYFDTSLSNDYFYNFEDLAWSTRNIPNTVFFKTAILLLKMRLYSWVELVLAQEVTIPKHYGYVNYMLSAVSYYQQNFDHVMDHIEEAKEFQGGDFAILGLSGHCLLAQNCLQEAKEQYYYVMESFDRPDDIHLIYLNCSNILGNLGEDQEARKLILIACKYHQTPYVWLSAGKFYYQENDLLSAEECLTEANMRDNRYAEVWAYLTLVNLKFNRLDEAEQCYQQAVKSKLEDEGLISSIKEEFQRSQKLGGSY